MFVILYEKHDASDETVGSFPSMSDAEGYLKESGLQPTDHGYWKKKLSFDLEPDKIRILPLRAPKQE